MAKRKLWLAAGYGGTSLWTERPRLWADNRWHGNGEWLGPGCTSSLGPARGTCWELTMTEVSEDE